MRCIPMIMVLSPSVTTNYKIGLLHEWIEFMVLVDLFKAVPPFTYVRVDRS